MEEKGRGIFNLVISARIAGMCDSLSWVYHYLGLDSVWELLQLLFPVFFIKPLPKTVLPLSN
jgi:hypothetical protein